MPWRGWFWTLGIFGAVLAPVALPKDWAGFALPLIIWPALFCVRRAVPYMDAIDAAKAAKREQLKRAEARQRRDRPHDDVTGVASSAVVAAVPMAVDSPR